MEVPEQHSRQGSIDNNVQFFIGSSRNSPSASTGSSTSKHVTESSENKETNSVSGHHDSVPVVQPQLTQEPGLLPISTDAAEKLVPNFTSSPADMVVSNPPLFSAPDVASTPTHGFQRGSDHPFRRSGSRSDHKISKDSGSAEDSNISLDTERSSNEPPSPILSHDDTLPPRQGKTREQSPIMPRKESPFQPPQRRRNLSGSSEMIEENVDDISSSDKNSVSTTRAAHSDSFSSSRSSGSDGKACSERDPSNRKGNSWRSNERRSRPPPGPRSRPLMSPRRMQEAYQTRQAQRAKHSISPAASLWADDDKLKSNILLAPAAPLPMVSPVTVAPAVSQLTANNKTSAQGVLTPVENLISSLSEQISSKENTPEPPANKSGQSIKQDNVRPSPGSDRSGKHGSNRHERNSSIDRELEICRKQEEEELDKERHETSRDGSHYSQRDQYKDDRHRPRDPREPDYDPYFDRQRPPQDGYNRANQSGRDPYRDPYYDRNDRSRSRNSVCECFVLSLNRFYITYFWRYIIFFSSFSTRVIL